MNLVFPILALLGTSLASAKAAEGPLSMAFEAGGKAWLVTLGPKNGLRTALPMPRPTNP